jgi:maltooligosyltrehalose trehalohydrolase
MEYYRRMPVGAEVQRGGGTRFRVWAIKPSRVGVRVSSDPELNTNPVQAVLDSEGNQYFSGYVPRTKAGDFYKFIIDDQLLPDPAARAQYGGPHGSSVIIDPDSYPWHDGDWDGVSSNTHVVYEMHLGTFTTAGTWASAT